MPGIAAFAIEPFLDLQAPTGARCARRTATIEGTAGRDVLRGTRGRDVIAALGGNDVGAEAAETTWCAAARAGTASAAAPERTTCEASAETTSCVMRRYMHQYGYDRIDFAPFAVNAHANGAANPFALYRFPITVDKVRSAAMVSEPLGMLDCSTAADGAAALLLASEGWAREAQRASGSPLVRIAGSAVATDTPALHSRTDPLWLEAAARSSAAALRGAGMTPRDIQALELSDPHGIAAALALEACGFAERGAGVQLARDGGITPGGATPLATAGGCKARGDTVGANGVYQVVELMRQLRGEAGKTQVSDVRAALAQCLGGLGATAATHILVAE